MLSRKPLAAAQFAGLIVTIACLASVVASSAAADYTARGTVKCANKADSIPLGKARVELWDDGDAWNSFIKATYTDTNGTFKISVNTDEPKGGDDDDVFISVQLTTPDELVEVFDQGDFWNGPDNLDSKSRSNASGKVDFRTFTWAHSVSYTTGKPVTSGTPACAVFLGARRAANDYRSVTGSSLPFPYDIVNGAFTAGVPYTNNDQTAWPPDYRTGRFEDNPKYASVQRNRYQTSFHEFAHVFRHHFDGSYAHFLHDVGDHGYAQQHWTCKHTNPGEAFNEGWALFWESLKAVGTCPENPTSLEYEGNVANRLQYAESCSSRKIMVDVLRKNPGRMHRFGDFASYLADVKPKCAADANSVPFKVKGAAQSLKVKAAQSLPPPDELPLSTAHLEAEASARIGRLQARSANLAKQLRAARARRLQRSSCRTLRLCLRRGDAIVRTAVLAAQLEQVKAQISYVEQSLTDARTAGFQPTPAALAVAVKRDAAFATASRSITVRGLKDALAGLHTAVKGTPSMRRAAGRIGTRLRTARQIGGFKVPDAFVLRTSGTDQRAAG